MDVGNLAQPLPPRPDGAAERRSEALAEKRRALSLQHAAQVEESRARAADRLAELKEAVARVVGADTRLSIARSDSFGFVYRAIDIETGEVVHEWPQQTFLNLVRAVREDVRADVEAGLILDRVA
jgi:uncharacterized FlaG/YvyC family protein